MTATSKKKFFLGFNWKMNPTTLDDAIELFASYVEICEDIKNIEVANFLPSAYLGIMSDFNEALESMVHIGAQDVSPIEKGAVTGEVPAVMLKDLKCKYALTGHSETRKAHKLNNEQIKEKNIRCYEHEIVPVYCIGFQDDSSVTEINYEELKKQVTEGTEGLSKEIEKYGFILAYEPIWAIGTGKSASTEIIQEAVNYLREVLVEAIGQKASDNTRILYGGSVTDQNALQLSECKNLDGFLIGGASLVREKFEPIITNLDYEN
jgi:triosephosphate isomerase